MSLRMIFSAFSHCFYFPWVSMLEWSAITHFSFSYFHSLPHGYTPLPLVSPISPRTSILTPPSLSSPYPPSSSSSVFFSPRINLYYLPLPSLLHSSWGRGRKRGRSFFFHLTMAGFLIFLRHGFELQFRGVLVSRDIRGFMRMGTIGTLISWWQNIGREEGRNPGVISWIWGGWAHADNIPYNKWTVRWNYDDFSVIISPDPR